jgi:hypothetical protein
VRDYSSCEVSHSWKGDVALLYAIGTYPGLNQAFLVSLVLATGMTLLAIPYGKRRPIGTPVSWGEAMLAAAYAFMTMFIAYGVVPDRWIQHSDKNLEWTKQKLLFGPFDILKDQVHGGHFPFTVSYQELRDIIVVLIHVYFFALQIWIWHKWQTRGKAAAGTEIETSTYGRPLVKKV